MWHDQTVLTPAHHMPCFGMHLDTQGTPWLGSGNVKRDAWFQKGHKLGSPRWESFVWPSAQTPTSTSLATFCVSKECCAALSVQLVWKWCRWLYIPPIPDPTRCILCVWMCCQGPWQLDNFGHAWQLERVRRASIGQWMLQQVGRSTSLVQIKTFQQFLDGEVWSCNLLPWHLTHKHINVPHKKNSNNLDGLTWNFDVALSSSQCSHTRWFTWQKWSLANISM